jgi:hypothetical protein
MAVFIGHSSNHDREAREICSQLVDAISLIPGLRACIDYEALRPGDEWNPTIRSWLIQADAAILVLTPKALESHWVYHEATLLDVRRSLGAPLVIIPVLVDVDIAAVQKRWPDLDLSDFHAVRCRSDRPDEIERAVTGVTEKLGSVSVADDAMRRWVGTVVHLLQSAPPEAIQEGAFHLGLYKHTTHWHPTLVALAGALLDEPLDRVNPAVRALAKDVSRPHRFIELVSPVCISSRIANPLSKLLGDGTQRRRVALNASDPITGHLVVDRALYCSAQVLKADVINAASCFTVREVMRSLEGALEQCLCLLPGHQATNEHVRKVGMPVVAFIRLGTSGGVTLPSLQEIVEEVHSRFPDLILILSVGSSPIDESQLGIRHLIYAPSFDPGEEETGCQAVRQWQQLVSYPREAGFSAEASSLAAPYDSY